MNFEKYQHLEKYGNKEVEGIEYGMCYIFPKIDGTNSSVWIDENLLIKAGSRNRELSLDKDNAGFFKWVLEQENIKTFFEENMDLRLYGEWLIPHSLKTYNDCAWKNFYVFDVVEDGKYLSYDIYKDILDQYNIEYIPPLCKIKNPSHDNLLKMLQSNYYLIKDGCGVGEGIVIKNYDFVNSFGNTIWAKIVTNEFKTETHKKVMGIPELKEKVCIESLVVENYITKSLINKEYNKIKVECNGWSSKYIPRLLSTVFYCLIKEESYSFIKRYKNPVIDYKKLNSLVVQKIKEIKGDLF